MMEPTRELLDLEQQFWTGDAAFYAERLATDAVMVFADPVGTLTGPAIVESIRAAPRWRVVDITEAVQLELSPDAVLLTYRARASRGENDNYAARATSVYVRHTAGWRLAFHQQTPAA
jgi:ketosteroid isomerase-like protein